MASKKDLAARIVALEVEVAALRKQIAAKPAVLPDTVPSPYHPNDWYPFGYPQVWCGDRYELPNR